MAAGSPPASAPASTGRSPAAAPTPGTVTTIRLAPAETSVPTAVRLAGARPAPEELPVAVAGAMSGYDREALFGGWTDADGDCDNTRNAVLARDLTDITSADGCTVATGTLEDPSTGSAIAFVREVVATRIAVRARYGLWVTAPEKLAMREMLAACPEQQLPGGPRSVTSPGRPRRAGRSASRGQIC